MKCTYCGSLEGPMHKDHIIPASRGGSDEIDNCILACEACNLQKSNKTPSEWQPTDLPAWIYDMEIRLAARYRMVSRSESRKALEAFRNRHDPANPPSKWLVTNRRTGYAQTVSLSLGWHVNYSAFSDDYTSDEISAHDLLNKFARYVASRQPEDPTLSIYWYVWSPDSSWKIEQAPLYKNFFDVDSDKDFLDYFEWPVDPSTGERLEWLRLPLRQYRWRDGISDKGGFIQEATGWAPGVFQRAVSIHSFFQSRGLQTPGYRLPP